MRAVLDGCDVLAVMPTGSGKSLGFQLPAVLLPGTTIVVSPLIALMKDQIDALTRGGIRAGALHSGLSAEARRATIDAARAGVLQLLYVAPERFVAPAGLPGLSSTTSWFRALTPGRYRAVVRDNRNPVRHVHVRRLPNFYVYFTRSRRAQFLQMLRSSLDDPEEHIEYRQEWPMNHAIAIERWQKLPTEESKGRAVRPHERIRKEQHGIIARQRDQKN